MGVIETLQLTGLLNPLIEVVVRLYDADDPLPTDCAAGEHDIEKSGGGAWETIKGTLSFKIKVCVGG